MTPLELCATLRNGMPGLFECSPAPNGSVRVRTPMTLPDGDLIDVFMIERDRGYVVTDFGDTLGWLRMQSPRSNLTQKQQAMVDDICLTLGIEQRKGQLVLHCADARSVPEAVLLLAQGAMRVASVWFTFPTFTAPLADANARADETTADQVEDWLRQQRRLSIRRNVKHAGGSGRQWKIDYEVSTDAQTSLVFLLTAGTRPKAQRLTEHVLTGCLDLRELRNGKTPLAFVSLFDDTRDVWREEDFKLMKGYSNVAFWSRRNEIPRILATPLNT